MLVFVDVQTPRRDGSSSRAPRGRPISRPMATRTSQLRASTGNLAKAHENEATGRNSTVTSHNQSAASTQRHHGPSRGTGKIIHLSLNDSTSAGDLNFSFSPPDGASRPRPLRRANTEDTLIHVVDTSIEQHVEKILEGKQGASLAVNDDQDA